MNELKQRIHDLLERMNERVYGKEHVIALSLLSAIAGESIFCSDLREWRKAWWHVGSNLLSEAGVRSIT